MNRTSTLLRRTPVFWESLRIPYSVIVLLLIGHFDPGSHEAHAKWLCMAFFGLLPANAAYCFGPLAEYYFLAFGPSRSRWPLHLLRLLLLAGGLTLSLLYIRAFAYVIVYGI